MTERLGNLIFKILLSMLECNDVGLQHGMLSRLAEIVSKHVNEILTVDYLSVPPTTTVPMTLSCPCHEAGLFRFVRMSEEQMENLKELSRHELLALKEIHLTGQASDKG